MLQVADYSVAARHQLITFLRQRIKHGTSSQQPNNQFRPPSTLQCARANCRERPVESGVLLQRLGRLRNTCKIGLATSNHAVVLNNSAMKTA
jgi:hypothetical protein